MAELPLEPESIVDLTWGLTLYFSGNKQEKSYGERNMEGWYDLRNRFQGDSPATRFLDNVSAAMSATILNLANTRKEQAAQLAFVEGMKNTQLKDLEDLANLTKDAGSIASRLAGVSIGGASFLGLASATFGGNGVVYFLVGGALAYLIVDAFLKRYRSRKAIDITNLAEAKRKDIRIDFEAQFKKLLDEFLGKVKSLADEFYPGKVTNQRIQQIASVSSQSFSGSVFASGGVSAKPAIWPWIVSSPMTG